VLFHKRSASQEGVPGREAPPLKTPLYPLSQFFSVQTQRSNQEPLGLNSERRDNPQMRVFMGTVLLALAGCLVSCGGNLTTYYRPDATTLERDLLPWSRQVQILGTSDIRKDGEDLLQRGYLPLGSSSFSTSESVTEHELRWTGQLYHADIVLYQADYLSSTTAAATLFRPGIAVTVPVTTDRYGHAATFWRKARPSRFGVRVAALPDDLRTSLERNTGVLVRLVVDDSPAFRANILPGDVLVGIDSVEIESPRDFTRKVDAFAGKRCNVVLIRNGEERLIPVKMNR